MSGFRDKLQPASVRGVPCLVTDASMVFGRRVARVEFPYRDKPFIDDMGKKARDHRIDLFLLDSPTNDLFKQRDALIAALEAEGPLTFVHPRLGALRLQVGDCEWRIKPAADMEHITVQFFVADGDAQPRVTIDTLDGLKNAAEKATGAQGGFFATAANFAKQASFVIDSARDDINRGMQGIKRWTRLGNQMSDSLMQLSQSIDAAVDDVSDLILMPRQLAANVSTLVRQVMNLPDNVKSIMDGYRHIGSLWGDAEPIPQTTPSRVTQLQNQQAIAKLFGNTAAIEATRAVCLLAPGIDVKSNSESPFASADEAYATRDELLNALDAIAADADDTLYTAVVDLQASLAAHIAAHGNSLPRVERLSFGNELPMLVAAHRIDGNIERENDLTLRNRIRHPLFVAAGTELEVLRG